MSAPERLPLTVVDDIIDGKPLEVEACKRCGLAHTGLQVRSFDPPIAVTERIAITDWTMCPVTDAPMLLIVMDLS